jgi:dGTPase
MEGQLVDLADEIAYTSADLEDCLAAGLITPSGLENLSLWRRASAATEDAAPASGPHTRIRPCKAVLVAMADDLIQTATDNISALAIACVADVRAAPRRCVAFSDQIAVEVKELQDFLLKEVYLAGENARQDRLCRRILSDLFSAYLARADLLPNDYRRRIDADGLPRTVCDYIAGMTDRFCKAEHARIHG